MKKNVIRKVVFYLIAAALMVFYIYVLLLKPNYSEAYRMFYVTHEFKYFCYEEDFALLVPDSQFAYVTNGFSKNQGDGWADPEDNGTWSVGNESKFYIKADASKTYQLKMLIPSDFGYANKVYVNDKCIGDVKWNDERLVVIDIPAGTLNDGMNEFSIRTEDEIALYPVYDIKDEEMQDKPCNLYVTAIKLVTVE